MIKMANSFIIYHSSLKEKRNYKVKYSEYPVKTVNTRKLTSFLTLQIRKL